MKKNYINEYKKWENFIINIKKEQYKLNIKIKNLKI